MENPTPKDRLVEALEVQMAEASVILKKCERLPSTSGTGKLRRKIEAEIKFYNQLIKGKAKKEHIAGNNLPYLSSLVDCALSVSGFEDVMKPFSFPDFDSDEDEVVDEESYDRPERIVVDVVAEGGWSWMKVVARNPDALLASMLGHGEYGRRTLMHQIKDMVACSRHHPHLYTVPKVKVLFACSQPIPRQLQKMVEQSGAEVFFLGEEQEKKSDVKKCLLNNSCGMDDESYEYQTNDTSAFRTLRLEEVPSEATLNLDVSSMIAYVSALTNGRCNYRFQENILTEQAENERLEPVKPLLDSLFSDRRLICCESAFKDFQQITTIMAGPTEAEGTQNLISRLEVVPDEPSERTLDLEMKGRIKKRPLTIFGTGDTHRAITVTANGGFLRAAAGQGVHFVAFIHQSRALTEDKEKTASVIG